MRMMQGHVFAYPNQKTAIPSHVWLQREKDGKALILDVTPDQSEFYKGPIGFSSDTENKYGLSYRSEKELTLEKAKTQELWNRYKLLCSLMKIGGQENKV